MHYPWRYIKIISEISAAGDISHLSVLLAKLQYVIAIALAWGKKNGGR